MPATPSPTSVPRDTSTRPDPTDGDPRVARASVAVLMGGRSSEREVSLVSGRAVLSALRAPSGPGDRRGPARVLAVDLLPDGRFAVEGRALPLGEALGALARDVDVCFLALHGGEGEGGTVQGALRLAGIPFTGSDVAASALCLDKEHARRVAASHGIRVAPGLLVSGPAWSARRQELLRAAAACAPAVVVKPRHGGSSVGVRPLGPIARTGELAAAIDGVVAAGDDALVESLVAGVEATCPVLGPRGAARPLVPVEIRPREGRFFDYEEKYSDEGALELCPPESLSGRVVERLRELALLAHEALGCDGYSRSDFVVPREDGGEPAEPVLLEVNTLPGLTPRSLLPRSAAATGTDFRALCLEILRLALDARRSPA